MVWSQAAAGGNGENSRELQVKWTSQKAKRPLRASRMAARPVTTSAEPRTKLALGPHSATAVEVFVLQGLLDQEVTFFGPLHSHISSFDYAEMLKSVVIE